MKILYALLISLSIAPIGAMQKPVGQQNKVQSDANQKQYNNQPFFTLAVLQPATGFKSLEAYVNQVKPTLNAAGYGLMPTAQWHLSVMIFAIPFPHGIIDAEYAQTAMDFLSSIVTHGNSQSTGNTIINALTDITFGFKDLKSIGAHKFVVAEFQRKKKPFFRVYGDIVRSFFNQYPHSWMFYGYGMLPHVSVASKMNAAGPATPTIIAAKPAQPVKDLKLRHKGKAYQRKIEINARWYDPQQKKMIELHSKAI